MNNLKDFVRALGLIKTDLEAIATAMNKFIPEDADAKSKKRSVKKK